MQNEDPVLSRKRICIRRSQLIINGILFGIWNNVSTIINATTLVEEGQSWAAALSCFFLFFPGLVTSTGLLILYWLGHKQIGKLPPANVCLLCILLMFLYPIVPIVLCIFTLFKDSKFRELATLSKVFEGFLDDGPQFVLRLVVFVLHGIGKENDRDDVIFVISMVTSFGSLVFFGLKFNERRTNKWTKWLLSMPMFAASVASRGFTLAVFLKETTLGRHLESSDGSVGTSWIGGLGVIIVFFVLNIATFKICGQDNIRSVVFGLSSTLIPAGYNNDTYFYQRPNQPLWSPANVSYLDGQVGVEEVGVLNGGQKRDDEQDEKLPKMRTGLFLVLHTFVNVFLLLSCTAYLLISTSGFLSESSGNALIFPQILAIIPGCFFCLARSVLVIEETPAFLQRICSSRSEHTFRILKIFTASFFGFIAYASLIPCALSSIIWKAVHVGVTEILKHD